jgi:hypothetical integral membrane protein (TIGR02206 family)
MLNQVLMFLQQFLTKDYQGEPFHLFGTAHLVALGIVLLVNLCFIFVHKRDEESNEEARTLMAAILISNEISWHIWNYVTGQWTLQTMLPLHLCSALVWLNAWMLLSKKQVLYDFAYLLGIVGSLQALLTPDLGIYGFPHYRFFQTFISHGLIFTSAIYMTVVEEFRPTWKSLLRVLVIGNLYMAAVFVLNLKLGSNYLFIAYKPSTPSLLDILPPWPFYILWIEGIGIASALLLYLPFAIKDFTSFLAMRRAGKNRLDDLF